MHKGFNRFPNWIAETEGFLEPIEIAVIVLLARYTIGFSGRKAYKFNWSEMARKLGVHRNTIAYTMNNLKALSIVEFDEQNGGNFMVTLNSQIPLWIDELDKMKELKKERKLAEKNSRLNKKPATNNSKAPTNKQQPPNKKVAGSGGAKYNLKDKLNKKKKSFDFKEFERAWFLTDKSCENLNRWLVNKFNKYKTEEAFNSLSPEQQKEVILSLKHFIPRMAKHTISSNNPRFMKQAHDYISLEEYIPYYKPIKDEIFKDKRDLKRKQYEAEADENKATDEERKEALSGFLNRKDK